MFRCAGTVPAMIALDSALNRRELPMQAIDRCAGSSRRGRIGR